MSFWCLLSFLAASGLGQQWLAAFVVGPLFISLNLAHTFTNSPLLISPPLPRVCRLYPARMWTDIVDNSDLQEEVHDFISNWNPTLSPHPVIIGHFALGYLLGDAESLGVTKLQRLTRNLRSVAHPGDCLVTHPSSQAAWSFQVQWH